MCEIPHFPHWLWLHLSFFANIRTCTVRAPIQSEEFSWRCHLPSSTLFCEMTIICDPNSQNFETFFTLSSCNWFIRHFDAAIQGVLCRHAPHSLTPINVQISLSQQTVPSIRHCLDLRNRHREDPAIFSKEKETQTGSTLRRSPFHFISCHNFTNLSADLSRAVPNKSAAYGSSCDTDLVRKQLSCHSPSPKLELVTQLRVRSFSWACTLLHEVDDQEHDRSVDLVSCAMHLPTVVAESSSKYDIEWTASQSVWILSSSIFNSFSSSLWSPLFFQISSVSSVQWFKCLKWKHYAVLSHMSISNSLGISIITLMIMFYIQRTLNFISRLYQLFILTSMF